MYITGKQLFFLIQVLKNSLDLPASCDWVFKNKHNERKKFWDELIEILVSQKNIKIQGDLPGLED